MTSFFFLSFQRGPPSMIRPSRATEQVRLQISPNITNDLRDASYSPSEELEINLAWVLFQPRGLRRHSDGEVDAEVDAEQIRHVADAGKTRWQGPYSAWKMTKVDVPTLAQLRKAGVAQGDGAEASVRLAMWVDSKTSMRRASHDDKRSKKRRKPNGTALSAGEETSFQGVDLVNALSFPLFEAPHDDKSAPVDLPAGSNSQILPVLSSPIRITSDPNELGNASKQTSSSRLFRLNEHDQRMNRLLLEIREEAGYELDKHIWDASLHLSFFFHNLLHGLAGNIHCSNGTPMPSPPKSLHSAESTLRALFGDQTKRADLRIVDLGAGTGLVSLVIASLLQLQCARDQLRSREQPSEIQKGEDASSDSRTHFAAKVSSDGNAGSTATIFATDLQPAVPLLQDNLRLNKHLLPAGDTNARVIPMPLDWDDDSATLPVPASTENSTASTLSRAPLESQDEAQTQEVDLVLASDCTYNPSSFPALVRTLRRLLDVDVVLQSRTGDARHKQRHRKPLAILAKKHRHVDEVALWDELDRAGLQRVLLRGVEDMSGDGEEEERDVSGTGETLGWGIWLIAARE